MIYISDAFTSRTNPRVRLRMVAADTPGELKRFAKRAQLPPSRYDSASNKYPHYDIGEGSWARVTAMGVKWNQGAFKKNNKNKKRE